MDRYKCFMENKSIIGKFCDCKPQKTLNVIKIAGSYQQIVETLDQVQDTKNIKR